MICPISIVSAFALIYFCGFTINTISLSGLALATGLIVDDAIVVLENIYRHIERDKKRSAEVQNHVLRLTLGNPVHFRLTLVLGRAASSLSIH